jgi:hypothetical protein
VKRRILPQATKITISENHIRIHELTKITQLKDGILTYPARKPSLTSLLPWEEEESFSKKGETR